VIYKKITKTKVVSKIAENIAEQLESNRSVLWLVSGGSNIEIEVNILKKLELDNFETSRLIVIPIDERYGKYNYQDSNGYQLRQAGFQPKSGKFIDVLSENLSFEDTIMYYNSIIKKLFSETDYVIGQFGLGSDGHVAGIKPFSPAIISKNNDLIIGYKWTDFDRLTLNLNGFNKINLAYLVAFGKDKKFAIERLKARNESVDSLPALLLNTISDLYVYNSYIESEA
jgi:6-phosphogluconolactonase/glucosamine-6-phosphate isomerase/deaminase